MIHPAVRLLSLVVLAACQRTPDRAPPPSSTAPKVAPPRATTTPAAPAIAPAPVTPAATLDLGDATRIAIGDLDGDGRGEIVTAGPTKLRVLDASGHPRAELPVTRGIQLLVVADLDGDKRAEIYAGWGVTREHLEAHAAFTMHRLDGDRLTEEQVLAPTTSRQDVSAIIPMPDSHSLLLAYFDSKYMVTSVIAHHETQGWTTTPVAQIRMATSYAVGDVTGDGTPDIVVGRTYGDDIGRDGDAFLLARDGARTAIPSVRGLRSITIADGDVFFGDGWDQAYAEKAKGRLSHAHFQDGAFRSDLVEQIEDQYAIEKILPATIDGKRALVTLGPKYVRVFRRDGDAWRGRTLTSKARDIAIGDLDGKPGDEIVVLGDPSAIY
jgi:hypothetical protein